MEESTWHEMVIDLSQRFSSMLSVVVFSLFISFKHAFYVDAERMIVKTRNVKKYLRRWFQKCMARYPFRSFLRRLLCSLCTVMVAFVYQMPHFFPVLRGQCKNLNTAHLPG